jgi:hypothetical protein
LWSSCKNNASFSGSFIHVSESPFKGVSHEAWGGGGNRRPAYNVVFWFPKGSNDTAATTPVPCSVWHNTFHLSLGRPEPCWAACVAVTLYRLSHVTQGMASQHVSE